MLISILPLLLLPLAYRYLRDWLPKHEAPRSTVWAVCATVGALINLWLSTRVLGEQHVVSVPLDDDFVEYCSTMATLLGWVPEDIEAYALRPPFPLLLATAFSYFEPLTDALFHSSQIATVGLSLLCFAWATLLGGFTAGVVALASFCAFAPLVTATFQSTTYPEMAFFTGLACFGGSLAVLRQDIIAFAIAGIGIGAAFLVDQMGIVWALPCLTVTAAALLLTPSDRTRKAMALLLPIAISYGAGRLLPVTVEFLPGVDTPTLQTLESRLHEHDEVLQTRTAAPIPGTSSAPGAIQGKDVSTPIQHGNALSQIAAAYEQPGFYWGRAGPLDLVNAITTLASAGTNPQKEEATTPAKETIDLTLAQRSTAAVISVLGMIGVGWRFRKRPAVATGLVLCLLPCAAWIAISGAAGAQLSAWGDREIYLLWVKNKLLLPGYTIVPVLLGLLWAMIAGESPGVSPSTMKPRIKTHSSWVRPITLGALAYALTLGWIPSRLAPDASWRQVLDGSADSIAREFEDLEKIGARRGYKPQSTSPQSPCRARLYSDRFKREAKAVTPAAPPRPQASDPAK